MKKIIIAITALTLSACSSVHPNTSVPATPSPLAKTSKKPSKVVAPAPAPAPEKPVVVVPPLPDFLSMAVPPLPVIVDGTIKGVMRDGARTDSMYNNLAARYKALHKAYDCVRESVNSRDASKVCF